MKKNNHVLIHDVGNQPDNNTSTVPTFIQLFIIRRIIWHSKYKTNSEIEQLLTLFNPHW